MSAGLDYRKSARCGYCGRRVVWCAVEGKKGRMICLERFAGEGGTVRVRTDHGYLWAKPLSGTELQDARDLWAEPLWAEHNCRPSTAPRSTGSETTTGKE